jgi:glycerol-3-phosphate dehydrogenase
MNRKTGNTLPRRDRRSHAERLTVDLPEGARTALKIHAARNQTTIRELIVSLVQNILRREQ